MLTSWAKLRAVAAMATMPSLLSKNACILGREHSAAKNAGSRIASPQFSLRSNVPLALSNDTPLLESTPTSCTLDMISTSLMPLGRPLGLDRPARCVLGVGAVAGAMMVFPEHAHAAEIVSNSDAWSLLVASEPKNALSLPTWVIHVASVAEWCVFLTFLGHVRNRIQALFEKVVGSYHAGL